MKRYILKKIDSIIGANVANLLFYSILVYLAPNVFVTFILYYNVILDSSLDPLALCVQIKCIESFYEKFKIIIQIYPILGNLFIVMLTGVGFIVAYRQFSLSKDSARFTNHFSNINNFTSNIQLALNNCAYINKNDIDQNTLYRLIFPESEIGNFSNFEIYKSEILKFREYLILKNKKNKANNNASISSKTEFIIHRKRIKNHCETFGITIGNISEGEFYEMENEVINFIDQVTKFSTTLREKNLLLKEIDRHYAR